MRAFADMIAPVRCVACGAEGADLCEECARRVTTVRPPWCERCGTPLGPAEGTATAASCPACESLGSFDRARSVVIFSEPARSLTLQLKRRGRRALADAIGDLLALLARREGLVDEATTVTWVPGGRTTRNAGFDHAALMARGIATACNAIARPVLHRVHDGPRQADVSADQRRSNVAGRFAARRVRGDVLLVDDVYTTGSTAEACAASLRQAGAQRVNVVTWARTPRLRPR